ncbi:MAG TPA: ribosomal protein S18-alanine N-acetyltransferase [Steroidobacteraceae bacterium]|nr:ribosomal protein S18-alanine N-acetyltransferase [Steroidobacteraceae bacterium]HQW07883.1 ribosomal protein S18-alanine N-acetyltransferase [Steroidobacteraceae bacterium]HQZ80771.1 ribosomal protein S18-alanine N-acetyltransferase [Steroidobacteraceae bacterium]
MTEEDLARVSAVERESYAFPWSEGIFRDCLRVGYVCRVVEIGFDLVGYAVMSTGAGEAHILNLCVRETMRGRGIGRTLLRQLLDLAAEAGVEDAFLEVRPSNLAAIRLYQSLGFVQVGVRKSYYQAAGGREDATVLRLDLRQPRH